MLREFKPSLYFLARFLGIYIIGNVAYGIYIESHSQNPDAFTMFVTVQAASVLTVLGYPSVAIPNEHEPTVFIETPGKRVLNMYEGCNGINVMVLFVAFIGAFGGRIRDMLWFVPAGLFVIHLFNLLRIFLLFLVTEHYSEYFYFVHKYFFTAILYLIVFVMWVFWVRFDIRRKKHDATG